MDGLHPLPLAVARVPDRDLVLGDLVAAVDLVAAGVASRVVVAGLDGVESVAALALVHAQERGVAFALAREGGGRPRAVIGPRSG